ncbi:MAG: hypothetical protein L0226_12415 [Acidobacteria bacterium]|nr:hypothetical protein [Acidobacteriota bacterium]
MRSSTVSTIEALLNRLSDGWEPDHYGLAKEFIQRLKEHLRAEGEIKEINRDAIRFNLDLSGIHLRGMEDVVCLLLGGDGSSTYGAARQFLTEVNTVGRLVCLLPLTFPAYEAAKSALGQSRCLLLNPDRIREWMDSNLARDYFKHLLWRQVSRRQLVPYSILLPVQGNMFFGRRGEIERLRDEPDVSFAIAGPGRLGKTSLVLEYQRQLVHERDPRATRKFYINFFDCNDSSDDGIARFIAMHIAPSSRSDRVTNDDLVQFLRRQYSLHHGSLELLLDEVDLVCASRAFKSLAKAARQNICRLVLCGRSNLLKIALSPDSLLECRVELLRLQSLDHDSARELLICPLSDLGFSLDQPDRIIERLFRLTGRMPHLLQFYGKKLANLAIEEGTDIITQEHLDTLRWDFETAQYFISPLGDLTDLESHLVALSLLKDGRQVFSVPLVREIAAKYELHLSYARIGEICNDLVINNILAWDEGAFRLANESLPYYARQMKLLDGQLKDAYDRIRSH